MNLRAKHQTKLTLEDMKVLTRPCVYLFIKAGVVQYVGRSYSGIGRPIGQHHQSHIRSQCDEIRIIWCETREKAYWKEKMLIFKYHPPYNMPCGGSGSKNSH